MRYKVTPSRRPAGHGRKITRTGLAILSNKYLAPSYINRRLKALVTICLAAIYCELYINIPTPARTD